jgi:[acyl-carrier-protein] S-malonyltransferase
MGTLAAQGVDAAIEIGCGRVLGGMMRRINKSLKVVALEDLASLKALQVVPAGA